MATKIWVGTDSGNEGDWGTAANWSPSGVPTGTDDVYLSNSSQAVTGSLNQSAVALTSLTIDQSYTGDIGTESTFLQVDPNTVRIGWWNGIGTRPAGSGRLNIDIGNTAGNAVTIYDSAQTATDTNRAPIRILAAHASHTVVVRGGEVAIEDNPDATGQVSKITVMEAIGGVVAPSVYLGAGLTIATLEMEGGSVLAFAMPTTATMKGGEFVAEGAGTITTLDTWGGTTRLNNDGGLTNLNFYGGDVITTDTGAARTIANLNLKPKLAGTLRIDPSITAVSTTTWTALDNPTAISFSEA